MRGGKWGEPLRGGRHSTGLIPSCLSRSSSQRHFLVLLAGGGTASGEVIGGIGGGVEDWGVLVVAIVKAQTSALKKVQAAACAQRERQPDCVVVYDGGCNAYDPRYV
jgi:hypothetical protein